MNRVILITTLLAAAGCEGALVGGECLDGYVEESGRCVTPAGAGGAGGADDVEGAGGGDDGSGGEAPSSTSSAEPGPLPIECAKGATICGATCADLATDAAHCGACGVSCPSGLCEEGVCLGGFAGHLVVAGIPAAAVARGTPSATLVANAVLLSPADPVRVALLGGSRSAQPGLAVLLAGEATERGRHTATDRVDGVPALASTIASEAADVVVIPGEALDDAPAAGDLLRDPLALHLARGGVVVVLASASSALPAATFLDAADLLVGPATTTEPDGPYTVVDFGHAIASDVPSPFALPQGVVAFEGADHLDRVVEDDEGDAVVLHRAFAP